MKVINDEKWFTYLDEEIAGLVSLSYYLLDREEMVVESLYDYSFVVFPIAKAYEGFLKGFLLDLGLITQSDWESDRFRIGRSLNPELPRELRDKSWVHDDLKRICDKYKKEGEDCAVEKFWKAWKNGRNKVFHYFGTKPVMLSLEEAKERIVMVTDAMELGIEYLSRMGKIKM